MVGYNVSKQEAYFRKAWQNAVELCVKLCKKYGLTERDIICHSEGSRRGIASNHADVMHWFPRHGESTDTFRAAVRTALNKTNASTDVSASLQVGDVVEVRASANTYYPGGATIPTWVKTDSYHKVTQVISNGKPVVKGGKICVLLGKKVDKKNGKESTGILSWIDVGSLVVIVSKAKEANTSKENNNYYRVQVGAFSNKENAEALLKRVKEAGFEGYIKED
ncbi:MAG: SPOR domain-containing protein [Bacillaceae bacterium]|nr:SPOR domain-containing protein [Bacillaceae bacterium]